MSSHVGTNGPWYYSPLTRTSNHCCSHLSCCLVLRHLDMTDFGFDENKAKCVELKEHQSQRGKGGYGLFPQLPPKDDSRNRVYRMVRGRNMSLPFQTCRKCRFGYQQFYQ